MSVNFKLQILLKMLGQATAKLTSLENSSNTEMKKERRSSEGGDSLLGEVERAISDADLLRIMECPVCNEFPIPPIYSCEKGHFTCNSCIKLLSHCSLCESAFTKVRNFALESIIESSKFKCRNAGLGCPEIVTGAEFNDHASVCKFRPLKCEDPDCLGVPQSPKEYFRHMVDVHAMPGCYKRLICGKTKMILKQSEEIGEYPSNPSFFIKLSSSSGKNDGPTFVIMTKRYRTFMCWWCVCLEPQALDKYDVSFSLEKSTGEDMSICWKLPLQPIWKTFDEIRDTGLCAVLPDTNLLPFYSDGKSWDLKVAISKKNIEKSQEGWVSYFKDYYPLLALIVVGVFAVITCILLDFGLTWLAEYIEGPEFGSNFSSSHDQKQQDIQDKYIGYRGFYYKTE